MLLLISESNKEDFILQSPVSNPLPRCYSESDLTLPPPKPPRSLHRRSLIQNVEENQSPRPLKLNMKSSRFKQTVMSPVLEYPEDLNPFGDDEVELDENKPTETKTNQYTPRKYLLIF